MIFSYQKLVAAGREVLIAGDLNIALRPCDKHWSRVMVDVDRALACDMFDAGALTDVTPVLQQSWQP